MTNEISLDSFGIKLIREAYLQMIESRHTYEALLSPLSYERHIDTVWSIYVATITPREGSEGDIRTVFNRQKFLLVALTLFCPQALVGGKMRAGLRPRISRLFGIRSETPISQNAARAILCYERYPRFREDCDDMLTEAVRIICKTDNTIISQNICICKNI